MRSSINCSIVICSPIVEFAILREATSETYGPRVYLLSYQSSINYLSLLYFCFAIFTFSLHIKNTKNIILSSLSDLTLVSDREGIDNPLSRWLRGSYFFVQARGLVRGLLLD